MKKKHIKSLKMTPSALYTVLVLIGFAAGFITKEFIPLETKPPTLQQPYQQNIPINDQHVSVCFTPNKQCQSQIIAQINNAKESIFVQAYSFTDPDIAQALGNAAKKGVDVNVLLDKSNFTDNRSAKDILIQNRIPIRFDHPLGIAHCKIMIFDQATVLTGSYNFSVSAYKRNTENLLILHNRNLAKEYLQNWRKRWDISSQKNRRNHD